MTITYHTRNDYNTLMLDMIKAVEGAGPKLYPAVDPTLTWGYGYTFLRKDITGRWSINEFLEPDLGIAELNISLSETELQQLNDIADQLNTGTAEGATQAAALRDTFITNWNNTHSDLSVSQQEALFLADHEHQKNFLLNRLQSPRLGLTPEQGLGIYNSLENTKELIAIMSLFYNAQTLVGRNLARALLQGNRAEAWYQIRYGWAANNPANNDGWAKRHYAESAVFKIENPGQIPVFSNIRNDTKRLNTD